MPKKLSILAFLFDIFKNSMSTITLCIILKHYFILFANTKIAVALPDIVGSFVM